MNDHLKGILITALGVLCVTPDSLFVRLISADPVTTAFGRGAVSGAVILVAVLAFQGLSGFKAVFAAGPGAWLYILLIGSTTAAFVFAVTNTSVANVVFIFATMPIFAAIFSRIFLGEPIRARMVWTITVVLAGLGVIAYGSSTNELSSWKGDIWALFVTVAFAGALTVARSLRATSMVPAVPIAYLGAALLLLPFADPVSAFQTEWPLFLTYGVFIGAGACLLSIGPRYITSPEVALLVLLESVLAPLLVWVVINENPGPWAISGGVVVIGALLLYNLVALRRRSGRQDF
jgi:drug/metabolite transporter (DMT)-like permease